MSNLQLYFAIGLPCITVIGGLIISLFQISGLRDDIREIRFDTKLITIPITQTTGTGAQVRF